jgi:hypothetical protein
MFHLGLVGRTIRIGRAHGNQQVLLALSSNAATIVGTGPSTGAAIAPPLPRQRRVNPWLGNAALSRDGSQRAGGRKFRLLLNTCVRDALLPRPQMVFQRLQLTAYDRSRFADSNSAGEDFVRLGSNRVEFVRICVQQTAALWGAWMSRVPKSPGNHRF